MSASATSMIDERAPGAAEAFAPARDPLVPLLLDASRRSVQLALERDAYRELLLRALDELHDTSVELESMRDRYHRLLDQRRAGTPR